MTSLAVLLGMVFMMCTVACESCKFTPTSPNGLIQAEKVTSIDPNLNGVPAPVTKFVVTEIKTKRLILITHAKYETPNDAKACLYSHDSKKFAAYYHYGKNEEHGYTWAGVWSLENGEFLYAREYPGWIQIPEDDFPEPPK